MQCEGNVGRAALLVVEAPAVQVGCALGIGIATAGAQIATERATRAAQFERVAAASFQLHRRATRQRQLQQAGTLRLVGERETIPAAQQLGAAAQAVGIGPGRPQVQQRQPQRRGGGCALPVARIQADAAQREIGAWHEGLGQAGRPAMTIEPPGLGCLLEGRAHRGQPDLAAPG
ncbi:hypothetical protein NYO99_06820 [Pelomonas sp. UHG3]|uniref:Uncharacterized protein n=1 Tax=Roseateles hydrophilus TaxID=2975054 RepID=A0ACC6C8D6_9BURK|nr:hypothetical protein [Pelomonas sp. UHG3]MCY4744683.1 hypothetical protein [Pelomonas sp. UHG3]